LEPINEYSKAGHWPLFPSNVKLLIHELQTKTKLLMLNVGLVSVIQFTVALSSI